jgi:hypothetical protein
MTKRNYCIGCALFYLTAIAAIPFLVWLAGGTFGQRCDRAFPSDGLAQLRCVDALANGRLP